MSEQAAPTEWETDRFGVHALPLRRAIWRGLQAAHQRALAAYEGLGLNSNDGYGLIWLVQHDELGIAVEEVVSDARRIKPARARYELVVVGDTNVILYPWKFADDAHTPVEVAKMTMSKLRENLLALTQEPEDQLSIEQAHLTQEELDAAFEDVDTFLADAVEAGRLVLIAYASNPLSGVLRVYWGEASQADDQGRLNWKHLEQIPPVADTDTGEGFVRPAGPAPVPGPKTGTGPRWDQAPLGEFDLAPRTPLTSPDGGHPPTPQPETGSDD
ncbi:hypothetical protein [Nocardia jinanensis]|uniref:Uncharacterized protein n=1 Tax=Nocardia jinanensis TaxID=382504 RepID=A0A917RFB8_9NOCA|nr:hypothetical protein [Nocardia jinanensis]GGL05712.1 hypothetical protein GCM10011588_20220 [Nocardia jinanensis]